MSTRVNILKSLIIKIWILVGLSLSVYSAASLNDYPQIKKSWEKGQLKFAIHQLQKESEKNTINEVNELLKKLHFQKKKFDQWIEKANLLLKQQKFQEAKDVLSFVKKINPNYVLYKALIKNINRAEEELKYPSKIIFDDTSLGDKWESYASYGGNFKKYAHYENNILLIDVPEKSEWGNTGIHSKQPIFSFKDLNESNIQTLKVKFDSNKTTSFIVSIEGYLRLVYHKEKENATLTYESDGSGYYGRTHYGRLDFNTTLPDWLAISMSSNKVFKIEVPDGRSIEKVFPKSKIKDKEFKVRVFATAFKKNMPAKLSLENITFRSVPEKTVYLSNLGEAKSIVLFDGKINNLWIPYAASGGNYDRDVHFEDKEMIVDVPVGSKWGEAGIASFEPVVWLDKLRKDGVYKLHIEFNSEKTTGFAVYAGDMNSFWKSPTGEQMRVRLQKDSDNGIFKLKLKIKNKLYLDENLTYKAPSYVTLSFYNGEVGIESDGLNEKRVKWSHIEENRALHLWVVSLTSQDNQTVNMALKKIVLKRNLGQSLTPSKPAEGVSPLSVKVIYDLHTQKNWFCSEKKKKKGENNCTLSAFPLKINIPEGDKSCFGMQSKEKIIYLDRRRINKTPLKTVMHFNSKKTDAFYVLLNKFPIVLERKEGDTYAFKWGEKWSRKVDASWLKNKWNGKLNIVMAKRWIEIGLDGGVAIRVSDYLTGKFPISILAAPLEKKMKYPINLELEKITTKWIIPDGMTAIERWNFIDDENFDPDAFLKELREIR